MIVNDIHVQGMFVYTDTVNLEKGDFVIKDGVIYICTCNNPTDLETMTVRGKDPATDLENFVVYLGDKVTSLKEYNEYISSTSPFQTDKYVSSHVLSEILNQNLFGFDESGVIDQGIVVAWENLGGGYGFSITQPLDDILNGVSFGQGFFDTILLSELNNAALKIDLSLASDIIPRKEDRIDSEGNSVCGILRQYTYNHNINDTIVKIRVQQLINPFSGISYYRMATSNSGINFENVTEWKASNYNSKTWKVAIDSLRTQLEKEKKELEDLKSRLKNNYCYKSLKIDKGARVILREGTIFPAGSFKSINSSDLSKMTAEEIGSKVLDIVIQSMYDVSMYKNTSITIDLNDSLLQDFPITKYYVGGSDIITLKVTREGENTIVLEVEGGINTRISSVFYREFYKG